MGGGVKSARSELRVQLPWISAQAALAIRHIVKVCGPPPPDMELEVQWQEHELGSYPTIVLLWEDAMRRTPWNYLERCRVAPTP